jgi:hypothetical protein
MTTTEITRESGTLTKSQQRAIAQLQKTIEQNFSKNDVEQYGAQITKCEVRCEKTPMGSTFTSVILQTEFAKLETTNLLRSLSNDHYLFFVGERGALELVSGPKSLAQFAGKKYMGWNVRKNYS